MNKRLRKIISISFVSVLCLSFTGCTKNNTTGESQENISVFSNEDFSKDTNPIATIEIEHFGTIKAELYPEVAPNTVNNFIELANKDFYNGLSIHRIVDDFVIQGGDPLGNGTGDAGYTIKGEFNSNGFKNNLSHEVGVLSMARSAENDSASSQFFIVTGEATFLDGEYAGFGKVIEGLDIVEKIDNLEVDSNDMPITDVKITSISIDTKGITYKSAEKIN